MRGRRAHPLRAVLGAAILAAPGAAAAQPGFADAHVHLNDPAAWVALMDESGIGRAVVLRGRSATHEQLVEASLAWPGRLVPFVSVSPEHREYRGSWEADDPGLAGVVDSLLATGAFHGIGELSITHFPGAGFPEADYRPDGALARAILDVARARGVPVLVHVEVTRLREFESLLSAYPEVDVVWAHGGYADLFLVERLLEAHPNLSVELSARTWVRHPRSPDYTILRDGSRVWEEWLALIERLPGRFLVGTDAALRSEASDREKIRSVLDVLSQLTPPTRAAVASGNLERLLGG